MKVLLAFFVGVTAVSALGSGPYLPSGWKPKGPAFLLPTEVQDSSPEPQAKIEVNEPTPQPENAQPKNQESALDKSSENVPEEIQESEASGSDFLREYGPPNVVDNSKAITEQALPDLNTVRPFFVIEARTAPEATIVEGSGSLQDEKDEGSVTAADIDDKTTPVPALSTVDDNNTEKVKELTSTSAEGELNISTTEAAIPSEVITDVTISPVEDITSDEGSTQSSDEKALEIEVSTLEAKSVDESQITERGPLEYLPPSGNEVQNDDELLKAKSNFDDSALEYLAPVANAEEKIGSAIPLFKATLENESQLNLDAKLEYFPPADVESGNSSQDELAIGVVSTKLSKGEVNTSDAVNKEANGVVDDTEESSGQDPILKQDEPVGFREYGPPKAAAAAKSEDERIENNETRKRRFSSKFVPVTKH